MGLNKIKVATWNIYGGRDQTGNDIDLSKDPRELLALGLYDVVGLQEVRVNFSGSHPNSRNPISALSMGMYPYGHFFKSQALPEEPAADFGQGLLSKFALSQHVQFLLPNTSTDPAIAEPRILTQSEIVVKGKKIYVFNAHLRWDNDGVRTQQMQYIKDKLDELQGESFVLFGDFNVRSTSEFDIFLPDYQVVNGHNGVYYDTYNLADWPTKRIDNIICSADFTIKNPGMKSTTLSDHSLLYTELEFYTPDVSKEPLSGDRNKNAATIHITDHQSERILTVLENNEGSPLFWNDWHTQNEKNEETFDFFMQGNVKAAEYASKRNRVIIPDEDGFFREFIITDTYQSGKEKKVYSKASYFEIAKQKTVEPTSRPGETVNTAMDWALADTEWERGITEYGGTNLLEVKDDMDGLELLKLIASTFDLELRFRIVIKNNRVVGRYVDMIKKKREFKGKEVELGKDLIGLVRRESQDICTALKVIGPIREDGTRLRVNVYDGDALKRWGRKGKHLWGKYEPQTDNQDITVGELVKLGEEELKKRINTSVQYEADSVSIEHIFGYEHEKVRLSDTIRIKDTSFAPPLYLEARVIEVQRQVSNPSKKKYLVGDFIEYREEDLKKAFRQLQAIVAQKEQLAKSPTPPTNPYPDQLWIDTSDPARGDVWKRWDADAQVWREGPGGPKGADGYTPIKGVDYFDGKDGYTPVKGVDYFDGKDGANGESAYLWVRYSQNADGSVMTTDPAGAKYIGTATTSTPTAPTSNTSYKWILVKGTDGIDGEDGANGQTSYLHIKYSNDGGQTFTANGGETIGDWIGTYVDFTQADSTNVSAYTWNKVKGEKGDPGKGVVSIVEEYFLSTSATTQTGGSWTTTVPAWVDGRYMWTRSKITYTDNTTSTTSPVNVTGAKGSDGADGNDGTGVSSVDVEYYLSTSPTSLAGGTWQTTAPAWVDGKYMWSRTKTTYTDGSSTYSNPACITGAKGDKGEPGVGVSSVTEYYLATSSSSGVTTSTSGWTTAIQTITSANKYLWNYEKITYTDGTSQNTPPIIIGAYGDTGGTGSAGKGITSITEYYLATSASSGVTTSTTGWTTTMQTTTPTNKYLWNYEKITYTDGTTSTINPIVIGVHGEKGDKGDTGVGISSITEYYLASASSSGVTTATAGWTTAVQTITATNKYLWNYEKITFSNGSTQNTTPVIIGVYGDTGTAGKGISSITEYYLTSSSNSGITTATAGWTTTMQTTTPTNKYLWNYEKITYTDSSTVNVGPVIIGTHGADGPQGPQGPQGPNIVNSTTVIETDVIKSNHIDVANLSAIVANLGVVTAGILRNLSSTNVIDMTNSTINFGNGKFTVNAAGDVTFKGLLSGATGSFSGDLTATKRLLVKTDPSTDKAEMALETTSGGNLTHYALSSSIDGLISLIADAYSTMPTRIFNADGNHFELEVPTYVGDGISSGTPASPARLKVPNGIENGAYTTFYQSMVNGWVVYGSGYPYPAYMKDPLGKVRIRGVMKSGVNGTVWTLPVGCRPGVETPFNINCGTGSQVGWGKVSTTGVLSVTIPSGANGWVVLDVEYLAEQ